MKWVLLFVLSNGSHGMVNGQVEFESKEACIEGAKQLTVDFDFNSISASCLNTETGEGVEGMEDLID
ncbi:hypothetical protein VIN01S_08470 [Vibrio inusitatus NBRC 102082]|uniref:Uncharacterized protein n=1 Tax=Vibrio inusitatus NBRC 102082 TaxID=1219070 RepID=A0A4Y3HSB2_9VIBR|nr:hypothetical protein [Vibrio inusitatus]GEA50043.1 hypothetical protein VIN01S_08470 [Vibrio inusitatus NBRC 102082]